MNPVFLGQSSKLESHPDKAHLDIIKNPHADKPYLVRFSCPEFTSICPVTGQPDFAHIVIDYVPNKHLVESKSLKLFMGSFRNYGDFHEACTLYIAKRMEKLLAPIWFRIAAYWYPRGGIPIDVFYQSGNIPDGVWVPETGVANYRGRG